LDAEVLHLLVRQEGAVSRDTWIELTVNGISERLLVSGNRTLLQVLREDLALTGTKNGCEAGECGACTVLVDGEPVNSCMMLAVEADGSQVRTVEGLAPEGQLSALQESFVEHNAVQCGFCTPGMLISAHALLSRNPHPTERQVREAIVGNLCRCTGYVRIVDAILSAADRLAPGQLPVESSPATVREAGAGGAPLEKEAPERGTDG
jgi:carbon-monoxide dehydrogenase small subunit